MIQLVFDIISLSESKYSNVNGIMITKKEAAIAKKHGCLKFIGK